MIARYVVRRAALMQSLGLGGCDTFFVTVTGRPVSAVSRCLNEAFTEGGKIESKVSCSKIRKFATINMREATPRCGKP